MANQRYEAFLNVAETGSFKEAAQAMGYTQAGVSYLVNALEKTVTGYASCNETGRSIQLKRGKVHYALLPVWLLSTKWQGKNYLFAMNGQTGKLVGDLPTSAGKFWGTFAAISAVLTALISAGYLLFA